MKIEISIKKNGKKEDDDEEEMEGGEVELMDEQKMAIGKKLKKNLALTRKERTMLANYLLKEED